jgi:NADH:ubiquinone oxidoreductase subunit 4 (subunit M)
MLYIVLLIISTMGSLIVPWASYQWGEYAAVHIIFAHGLVEAFMIFSMWYAVDNLRTEIIKYGYLRRK